DWLPDPVGGITWLAFDNPGLTPRVPIYAGVKELPASFLIGDKNKFRRDSAGWAFRRVNKLSNINWSRSGKMITDAVKKYEDKAFAEKPAIEKQAIVLFQQDPEKAEEFLTQYTNDFARSLVQYWWELGDRILER
ncbi:MAG: peptidase, partial [Planctomycetes bacterium]|nr:peptidase [Planctomycetota bacterium]